MSRETVLALRRFTQKMAENTMSFDTTTRGTPGAKLPTINSGVIPGMGGSEPTITPPRTSADEPQGLDRLGRPYRLNSVPSPTAGPQRRLEAPGADVIPSLVPGSETKDPGYFKDPPPPAADASSSGFDLSTLMQYLPHLGGLGAGGLAGYALGNMFQDEDDDSTPWLSTLAGAGLGTVALPYLMNYFGGQGGQQAAAAPPANAAAQTG